MVQDKKDLPEGTDEIIAGASKTGRGRTDGDETIVAVETTLVAERITPEASGRGTSPTGSTGSGGSSSSGDTGGSAGSSDSTVMQKLRSGGEKLSGQAADKARTFVGQGLDRSGEALSNVGRLVGDTADGLDERLGAEYGDYARRAADAIERTAQSLRSKNPDELIDDTREFVRKSPGVALAGAAIVGFALARLIKSGLEGSSGTSSDDREGPTGSGSSSRNA